MQDTLLKLLVNHYGKDHNYIETFAHNIPWKLVEEFEKIHGKHQNFAVMADDVIRKLRVVSDLYRRIKEMFEISIFERNNVTEVLLDDYINKCTAILNKYYLNEK